MGLPQPTVRIAFDLSLAGLGDFFTIGDASLGVLGTRYAGIIRADSPIGWWRLNEATGNALNQTGTVNGVYQGTPTRRAGALASDGNSVGLNGSTQWVAINAQTNINSVATDNWSVEAWFVCNNVAPTTPQIVWEEGGTVNGVSIYVYDGELFGIMWTADTIRKRISVPISSGVIYHAVFVGTVTANRCEMYLNGVSVGSPTTNTAFQLPAHGDPNGIGSNHAGTRSHTATNGTQGTWSFNGRIGDVARYNYGLSATQVAAHYDQDPGTLAPLLGPTPQDVTEFVRSISIRRGRSKFSDTFDAGQATIVLDNRARTFDPSNLGFTFNQPGVIFDDPDVTFDDLGFGSPFAPSMTPRKAVTMEVGGQLLMTGIVEDYDLAYSPDGDSTCTVKVADGFTLIAQAQLTAGTPVAEDTGARIGAVLDDNNVAWPPLRRELDTGLSTVGTAVIGDNQNALQYLNLVNASEPGAVFIDRRGFVRFRNRSSLQSATGLVFSDDADTRDQFATGGNNVFEALVGALRFRVHEFTSLGSATFTPSGSLRNVQVLTDRFNLVPNPSFETNTTNWGVSGAGGSGARNTTEALFGVASLARSFTASGDGFAQTSTITGLAPGQVYTASAFVKSSVSKNARVIINFYNSSNAFISQFASTATATSVSAWQRRSVTGTVPANGDRAIVFLSITNGANGETHYWDGVLFERTSQLRPYFDGNTYDGTGGATVTTTWDGTANNSTSRANILTSIPTLDAPLAVNVDVQPVTVRYPLANALPFSAITREIGTEQLYTQINVNYPGGTETANDLDAQEKYGITALNWNTLLDSQAAAEGLAEYWGRRYSAPTTRLDGVDIIMDGLSATQRGQVLALELGDLVSVRFTPNGIGNPLEQAATVEQITHDITPGGHRVRLGLISGLSGFIIGESILGEEAVGF
jgi:hypothetical protein